MASPNREPPNDEERELLRLSSASSLLAGWSPSRGGEHHQVTTHLSSPPSVAPPAAPPSVCLAKYSQEQNVWVCTADLKRPITILFRRREREPCCAELSITDKEGNDLLAMKYIQHCYGKEAHFAWNYQTQLRRSTSRSHLHPTTQCRPFKEAHFVHRPRACDRWKWTLGGASTLCCCKEHC